MVRHVGFAVEEERGRVAFGIVGDREWGGDREDFDVRVL